MHVDQNHKTNGSKVPPQHDGIDYLHVMPALARARATKLYLEVGVCEGLLLSRMDVEQAIGIDPAFRLTHNVARGKRKLTLIQETSDQFFTTTEHLCGQTPDLVFLDGMHRFEYLLRDFINAESLCSERSLIVMHDCLPFKEHMMNRSQDTANQLSVGQPFHGYWTGDVWKIVPILQQFRPDLKVVFSDAAPTGLVFVTKLAPGDRTLSQAYLDIVDKYAKVPDNMQELSKLYASINMVSAAKIIEDHSQYFLT